MMIGLRRMIVRLRRNEGEFPHAEIFDKIKNKKQQQRESF